MKSRLSFRGLIILLYIGTVIPLLALVGFATYALQYYSVVSSARSELVDLVTADVKQVSGDATLAVLATNLYSHLQVLNAEVFVQDISGLVAQPTLGAKPWSSAAETQVILNSKTSILKQLGRGTAARIVFLAPIIDPSGQLLGTVEASLALSNVTSQLKVLRTWLLLSFAIACWIVVALSITISRIVTRPMISLVESVNRVRKGNLESRAEIPQVYELGQLALSYNQMRDRISEELHNQAQLAENMRRFAADASHELRSPLAVFRSSVELLKKAFEQNDQKSAAEILAILPKETDVMSGLVDNLLLLARLDQSEEVTAAQLHPDVVYPFPLLEEVYERSQLLATGQKLDLIWPNGVVAPIWADREMLRRALNNIVENAIAYTPAGRKISLSVDIKDGTVSFVIEDQGSGIAEEKLARIFDRFYRGDEARNRQTAGTGLGLAIVAAIVRVHKGEIQVESKLSEGSRFRLVFKQLESHPPEV